MPAASPSDLDLVGPSPQELGALLRRLRLGQGLTVEDLSKRSSILASEIEEIEQASDPERPQLDDLLALGRGLGMDVSAILRVWESGRAGER